MVVITGYGEPGSTNIGDEGVNIEPFIATVALANIDFSPIHMIRGQECVSSARRWRDRIHIFVDRIATTAISAAYATDIPNVVVQE